MSESTNKTQAYLRCVEKAKKCIAGLSGKPALNPQRLVDDVRARVGGDIAKVEAAFEAYGKQEGASTSRNPIVEAVLKRRRSKV